jgi:antitoxin VapB
MATAKLFKSGRSQAVRLPKTFRFEGTEVSIRRFGKDGVILEPVEPKKDLEQRLKAYWQEIDRLRDGAEFMPEGRQQPESPPDDWFD